MKPKNFKYAGLAAIVLEYTAFTYFLFTSGHRLDPSSTVSDFGAFGTTSLLFSITFSLAGILFGLFGIWLRNVLPLHRNFIVVLYIGVVAQIGLSWLPVQGSTQWLHFIFASIVMIVMPLLVYYFSLANKNLKVRRMAQGIVAIELLAAALLPFGIVWHVSLIAEALTFIGFQLWVVLATFERHA